MFGGAERRRSVADLSAQLAELRGRVDALAAAKAEAPPPVEVTVTMPEQASGGSVAEAVAVAEFFCREVSAIAAEVLQLGYGYDIDTVQMLWSRFGAGDRQVFLSALTGPGGEGLAMHLANAADDPDFGEDFEKALARLVDAGTRFVTTIAKLDPGGTVAAFYVNGPLGTFLEAAGQPDDAPAEA